MVLTLVWLLAGLLAVSLTPGPISAAVNSSIESAELRLADADAATPTTDADVVVPFEAAMQNGWHVGEPGASRFVATAALRRAQPCVRGAQCDRAPPLI